MGFENWNRFVRETIEELHRTDQHGINRDVSKKKMGKSDAKKIQTRKIRQNARKASVYTGFENCIRS